MSCKYCGKKAKNYSIVDNQYENYNHNNNNNKKEFKIRFCDKKKCKSKTIESIKFLTNIEDYFYSKKNKNEETGMEYIQGNGNDNDEKKKKQLKEEDFSKEFPWKGPIFINNEVMYDLWKNLNTYFFKELMTRLGDGPSLNLIQFFDSMVVDENPFFKEFVKEEDPNYKYELKIKTNIWVVDYNVYFESNFDDDDEEFLKIINEPNLLKLPFKSFKQLIDFIRKFDNEYLSADNNMRSKNPKNKIYTSLISATNLRYERTLVVVSFNETQYQKKYHDSGVYFFLRETINKFILNNPDLKDFNEKYWQDFIDFLEGRNIPKHFVNSFRDEMINGVDIFTLVHAFVTNEDTLWEFEFYLEIYDYNIKKKISKKVNFLEYLFHQLINRFTITLQTLYLHGQKLSSEQKTLLGDNTKFKSFESSSEKQLFLVYTKLSMIIPIFFANLFNYQDIYKKDEEKTTEDFYSLSKKLGENLVYTILIVQNFEQFKETRKNYNIKLNLLNKFDLFRLDNFYVQMHDNFINNNYIELLNEIEYNNMTEDIPTKIRHSFVKNKMEMWIFYFMTGFFSINVGYSNIVIKQHSHELYKLEIFPDVHKLSMFNTVLKYSYSRRKGAGLQLKYNSYTMSLPQFDI